MDSGFIKYREEQRKFFNSPKWGKTIEENRVYMKWWNALDRDWYDKKCKEWNDLRKNRRTAIAKRSHLKKKYGITQEQYDKILFKQGGVCAICGVGDELRVSKNGRAMNNLVVDHCHKKGHIRGIICRECNTGLGHFSDSPVKLNNAIKYLRQNKYFDLDVINKLEDL